MASLPSTPPVWASDRPSAGAETSVECFSLPADTSSVGVARHHVHSRLDEWGVATDVRDDAVVVMSEIVTNAVVHTDSDEVLCRVALSDAALCVQVTDQGRATSAPRMRSATSDDEGGRGLWLVDAYSADWGVARAEGAGRTVWAMLPCTGGDR